MHLNSRFALFTVLFSAWSLACGGSQTPPEPSAEPTPAPEVAEAPAEPAAPAETAEPPAEPAEPAEPAKPAWKDMTDDQKKELMKTVVLPNMKPLFQELDPKEFADMKCVHCHGAGAKNDKFDMPNPKLPKLDPKNNFEKHAKKKPDVLKFMMERVTPEMVKLLNVEPYNPETQQGFGCFNCHTMASK